MSRSFLFVIVATMLASTASAQLVSQQTVQLPTFHYFGVSTTVSVPARGTISLGGVNGVMHGRTRFDRVGSSLERSAYASDLSMSATIIDNAELDRAVLADAARRRGAKFDVLGRPMAQSTVQRPFSAEENIYLCRGRDAEATGQRELAKVFYRRAAKLGSTEAQDRLAVLGQ